MASARGCSSRCWNRHREEVEENKPFSHPQNPRPCGSLGLEEGEERSCSSFLPAPALLQLRRLHRCPRTRNSRRMRGIWEFCCAQDLEFFRDCFGGAGTPRARCTGGGPRSQPRIQSSALAAPEGAPELFQWAPRLGFGCWVLSLPRFPLWGHGPGGGASDRGREGVFG